MKKLLAILAILSIVASISYAVVKKASPEAKGISSEAKAKAKVKTKVKAKKSVKVKQTATKESSLTAEKNKVRQDAILQELKYEMTIKKGSEKPQRPTEDFHPSQQF